MHFFTQLIATLSLGLFVWLSPGTNANSKMDDPPQQKQDKKEKKAKTPTELFFGKNKALDKKVDSIYNSLSDQQKAAQMIMTASSTSPKLGYPYAKALKLVKNGVVGNVLFLKGGVDDFKKEVEELNNLPEILKPIYACDCEPSLMNGKWQGSQPVKKANQQKTPEDVEKNTNIIIKDMKEVGVQINFAPVADNSKNKEIISNRAFGNDEKSIVSLSQKFIEVSQNQKIATSVKHFPGHGNVKGDSHKELVFIDGALTELETFKSIIQGPIPPLTVMVGHIAIINNKEWNTNGLPATLSRKIVHDLLRVKLDYQGIITTDALNMLAAAKVPNADWKAVEAGVDLVLMPKDPIGLNKKIVAELQKGDQQSEEIQASIKRIIRLKVVLGIL